MAIHTITSLKKRTDNSHRAVWDKIREANQKARVEMDMGGTVIPSELRLDGHLDLRGASMAIDGDLVVTGTISVPENGALFVAGTVSCDSYFAAGSLFCTGALKVASVLYGNYEAGITYAPKAAGPVWLKGRHDFEFKSKKFGHTVKISEWPPSENYTEHATRLSDCALDLLFVRPRKAWEGDAAAAVSSQEILDALRNRTILRS